MLLIDDGWLMMTLGINYTNRYITGMITIYEGGKS
jgi:hypothetical protein